MTYIGTPNITLTETIKNIHCTELIYVTICKIKCAHSVLF